MTKPIDRAEMKAQTRKLLQTAQVSPKGMTALYCACLFLLSLLEALIPGPELVSTFLSILTTLAGWILAAGFALYCMDIRHQPVCVPVVHAVCGSRLHCLLPLPLRPL